MAASVDIGTLISKRPDFKGGDAYVSGTGLRVKSIVAHYKVGHSPEQIAAKYGHINLAQVHAALAYYHANRDEIEALLAEDNRQIEALERETRDHHVQAIFSLVCRAMAAAPPGSATAAR